jgi:hypothetical protein
MEKQPPCQWQQEDFPLSFEEACVLSFMSMASAEKEPETQHHSDIHVGSALHA